LAYGFDNSILNLINDWLKRGHLVPSQEALQQMKTFCEDYSSSHARPPEQLLKKLEELEREVGTSSDCSSKVC
jgi:hypothetical protein